MARKQHWLFAALFCLFILFLGNPLPAGAVGETIRVGFFQSTGIQETDSSGKHSGYSYDYLQNLAKYTGWRYEYVSGSWNQCLDMLENGEIDLLGYSDYNASRLENFDYSALEYGVMHLTLYVLEDDTRYNYGDVESIGRMRLGVIAANSRNEEFFNYCATYGVEPLSITEYSTPTQLLSALTTGEVDSVLLSTLPANLGCRAIIRLAPRPFYFMTAKDNAEIMEPLNAAMKWLSLIDPDLTNVLYDKYFTHTAGTSPVFSKDELDYLSTAEPLTVAYNPSWPPLSYFDAEAGTMGGISADVLELLSSYTGLQFQVLPCPTEEAALARLASGEADLYFTLENNFYLADTYHATLSRSFLSIPLALITNLNLSLEQQSIIAIPEGFRSAADVFSNDPYTTIRYYPTITDCLEALRQGEAGTTISNSYTATEYLKQSRYNALTPTTVSNQNIECCIAVSRAAPQQLVTALDTTINFISSSQMWNIVMENTLWQPDADVFTWLFRNPAVLLALSGGIVLLIAIAALCFVWFRGRQNKRIVRALYTDALTGHGNQSRFMEDAALELNSAPAEIQHATLYLDIDGFKYINDTYGYEVGDQILCSLAQELDDYLSQDEYYARISGDNFAALLRFNTLEALEARIKLLNHSIRACSANSPYRFIVSGGIYVMESDERDITVSIDKANYARAASKGYHQNKFSYYSASLTEKAQLQRELAALADEALRNGEFVPWFQPIVDINTGTLISAEALVRWIEPNRGMLSPDQFIPLFERNGFIVKLDLYIFEQCCKLLARWKEAGVPLLRIACNFTQPDFILEHFPDAIKSIASLYEVDPKYLMLEITETVAMDAPATIISHIQKLREYGFSIAIDDFGSGYSSLSTLARLPIDELKLDLSIVQQALESPRTATVASGVVQIAAALNLTVICEGVESTRQVDFIQKLGCSYAQGYYYYKPMPAWDLEDIITGSAAPLNEPIKRS